MNSFWVEDERNKYLAIAKHSVLGSIVVSISACHAVDPGSIPGRRVFFLREYVLGRGRRDQVSIHSYVALSTASSVV